MADRENQKGSYNNPAKRWSKSRQGGEGWCKDRCVGLGDAEAVFGKRDWILGEMGEEGKREESKRTPSPED